MELRSNKVLIVTLIIICAIIGVMLLLLIFYSSKSDFWESLSSLVGGAIGGIATIMTVLVMINMNKKQEEKNEKQEEKRAKEKEKNELIQHCRELSILFNKFSENVCNYYTYHKGSIKYIQSDDRILSYIMQMNIQLQIVIKSYPAYDDIIKNADLLKEKIGKYENVKERKKLTIEELDVIQDEVNLLIESMFKYI